MTTPFPYGSQCKWHTSANRFDFQEAALVTKWISFTFTIGQAVADPQCGQQFLGTLCTMPASVFMTFLCILLFTRYIAVHKRSGCTTSAMINRASRST